jgi:hypothetical protein
MKRQYMIDRWEAYRTEAFWKRVNRGSDDACWEWSGFSKAGPKNTTPYGALGWKGKHSRAHRVAYEITNGPIPEWKMVLHRCDNTLCCNPGHLYLGSHAQNMRDMVDRKRRKGIGCGERNGRAKLTQEQAEEIRAEYAKGIRSQQSIANEYNISQFAVSQIVANKRYRNDSCP